MLYLGQEHHADFIDVILRIVAVCSILHNILPPWEMFADFPFLQKWYKLFVYIIGYIALNARSTLYQGISATKGNNAEVLSKTEKQKLLEKESINEK